MNLRQFRMALGLMVSPWSIIRAMNGHIASDVLVEQLFAHPELCTTHVLALFCVESITLSNESQALVKEHLIEAELEENELRLVMEVSTLEWTNDNDFRVAMLMKLADLPELDTLLVGKIVRELSRQIRLEDHPELLEAFKQAVTRLEQRPDPKEVLGLIELANRKLALLKLLPPFSWCSVRVYSGRKARQNTLLHTKGQHVFSFNFYNLLRRPLSHVSAAFSRGILI